MPQKLEPTFAAKTAGAHLQLPPEAGLAPAGKCRWNALLGPSVQADVSSLNSPATAPAGCPYLACVCACVCCCSCYQVEKQEMKVCVTVALASARQWMKAAAPLIIERVLNNRSASLARRLLITGKVSHFCSPTFSRLPPLPLLSPHSPPPFQPLSRLHSRRMSPKRKHLSVFLKTQ